MNKLDEDGKLVTITSLTFSDIYVKSEKIKNNAVSGILQFKDAKAPVIPKIKVLNVQDFSKEGYVQVSGAGNIWFKTEKECYTLIEVKNNGTTPAKVWVVAYIPNVIDGGRKSLDPEEYGIFRIDYVGPYFEYKPEEGDLVTFLVFSESDSGIYLVKDIWSIFSPIYVSEPSKVTKSYLANGITQNESEKLSVIPYPIKTTLARVNMTTYDVVITVRNPFAYPINAKITQNTTQWNISLPAREVKTLNYTIHPDLGIKTTISPVYMEYFDFQHNVTVTFASDSINFTPSGIEIKGYLPYEIGECVEVNLSITNLLNITNGTFSLKLIGNETFEYNVTANIENISILTVGFDHIDVPEGAYIGILTFVGDNGGLIIDSRNMRRTENQPPTASFTHTPENPVINQPITFNASASYDPDGNIMNYTWNFGDSNTTTTTDPVITHFYSEAGSYEVTLTVTDNDGLTSSTNRIVMVGCGDLNSDGEINMTDVYLLLDHVGNHGDYEAMADVNCDGSVNMGDVILLLNHVGDPMKYKLDCCDKR